MSGGEDAVTRHVDAAAALLGFELAADSRREVIANARILAQRAADFTDLALDAAIDPAPVLRL